MDYNARYYSPYLGRFISPDTIVPDPASSQSFNRYAYVHNNPTNFVDPSGHIAEGNIFGPDGYVENKVAYLLGGVPQSEQAAKQIVDLAKLYDKVIVNDILFDKLKISKSVFRTMLKLNLEQYGYKLPRNVSVLHMDAAKLKISNADVYVVGPNHGLHIALIETAKNLGENTRLIVASNLPESAERLISALHEQNVKFTDDKVKEKGKILIKLGNDWEIWLDSDYLDQGFVENTLIWLIK